MSPRAVLFDMDGVLVRSEEVWFRAVSAAGTAFRGRAITREEFAPTFGQGTAADIPGFGLSCTPAELDAFYVTEFLKHLDAVWVDPDAARVLQAVADAGCRRALVTNTVGVLTRAILERAKLLPYLEFLSTADLVAHAKPAPDLLHLAMRNLNVTDADCLMVGDSRFDRQAAQAAGVKFLGLRLDGDIRLNSLADVLPALEGHKS